MAVSRNIPIVLHFIFIDFMITNEIFASQVFYNLTKYNLFESLILVLKFDLF